jgi:hypothetical protein
MVCLLLEGDLGGKTLPAGCYEAAAAISLAGKLTLDAEGASDAKWTFTIGAALTTAALSDVEIINPGDGPIVEWVVTGAVNLGAESTTIGKMTAVGAITVGADAKCGNLDATGAIALGAGATGGHLTAAGAIDLGAEVVVKSATTTAALTVGASATILLDAVLTLSPDGDLIFDVGAARLVTGDGSLAIQIQNGDVSFDVEHSSSVYDTCLFFSTLGGRFGPPVFSTDTILTMRENLDGTPIFSINLDVVADIHFIMNDVPNTLNADLVWDGTLWESMCEHYT